VDRGAPRNRLGCLFQCEFLSPGKDDGCLACAPEAEEVQINILGGGVCNDGTNWRLPSQSAALEVATRARLRRSRIPQAIFKKGPRGVCLSRRWDAEEDGCRGTT
jgi:hypothetical protein